MQISWKLSAIQIHQFDGFNATKNGYRNYKALCCIFEKYLLLLGLTTAARVKLSISLKKVKLNLYNRWNNKLINNGSANDRRDFSKGDLNKFSTFIIEAVLLVNKQYLV